MKIGKVTGIAFVLATLFFSASCSSDEEVEEIPETPVAVAEAFTGSLSGSNRLTGIAKAGSDIIVMPKSVGQIVEVLVARGEQVEAGQTLARLENKDQQLALEVERAGLRQAENGLQRARNGLTQTKNNHEQAKSNLEQAKSAITIAEQGQEASLQTLQIELENANKQLATAASILDQMKDLSEDVLKVAEAEEGFKAAQDGLERIKLQIAQTEQIAQAETNIAVEQAKAQVEQAELNLKSAETAIRDAEIAVSDAGIIVEQRKIAVELSEKRLRETDIKAPVAGQISQLDFEVGEMVSNQTSFARLISDEYIDIELSVSAAQLIMVKVDDKVEVEFSGVSMIVEGTVTYIALAADQTGLFKIEVQVDNNAKNFRSGMVATINVEEVLVADSLIVPTSAVVERQDLAYIFIVVEDIAIEKEVEVIRYDTDFTALIGEISEGDQVVVKGQNLLSDGDAVRIVREEK